jgi:hypothetical protein
MTETHPHQEAFSTGENVLLIPVDDSKPKPFSKFTEVVKALTDLEDLNIAMAYAKFYYEHEQTVEENITRITNIIKSKP